MSHSPATRSPWPHRWAWLLACATFPLIWVGGLVTSTDAGMAFRDWLTSDGHFMLFYPWLSSAGDKFVEHGHRLLGAASGFLSIGLVVVCVLKEPRTWVRRFSYLILAAVVLQGVLGGMRVVLDERTLAMIHGCTGPLFFGLTVAMVVFTSSSWGAKRSIEGSPQQKKLLRVAILCTALAYLQLVVGAVVRHSPYMLSGAAQTIFQVAVYFHLLLAVAIVVHVAMLLGRSLNTRLARGGSIVLALLVGVQVLLGGVTWILKYGMPHWAANLVGEYHFVNTEADFFQAAMITSHVAVGSLILVASLAIALHVGRRVGISLPRVAPSASKAGVAL